MLWLLRASICGLMLWACSIARADVTASTHTQARALSPVHDGVTLQLKTFCMGPDENLWLCCSGFQGLPDKGGILVLQPSGEFVRLVELDFVPTAINFTPDGTAGFVAGSGMLAKLSAQGEVLKAVATPNLLTEEEAKKRWRAHFEETNKELAKVESEKLERLTKQLDKLKSQIAAAEEQGDERALTRAQSRLKIAQKRLDAMQKSPAAELEEQAITAAADYLLAQSKKATAIAVTKEDVFASLGGDGFEIWRMNHDLEDGRCINDTFAGCCGQLDIQADGADILIAANTLFRVVRIDRDGKELSSFGEQGNGDSGCGWGSCCNPMNIRVVGDELLAGESSIGHLKRYSKDGKYLGLVGTARIGDGCKHVALAVDTKRNWYFMMNQNRNKIAVLLPKEELPDGTEDERLAREARDGLGKNLLGEWECSAADITAATVGSDDPAAHAEVRLAMFRRLQFHPNGDLSLPNAAETLFPTSSKFPSDDSALLAAGFELAFTWEAVRQEQDQLTFLVRWGDKSGRAAFYGGTVRFVDAETITIQWCGDDPREGNSELIGGPITYKRLPDQARAEGEKGKK